MSKITVYGFRNEGPIYSVAKRRVGRRFRRNRHTLEHVGTRGGRNIERPEHQFVHHGGTDYIIFNKGHVYRASAVVDGDYEIELLFDASEDYVVSRVDPSIEIGEITVVGAADDGPVGDDEDREGDASEEE